MCGKIPPTNVEEFEDEVGDLLMLPKCPKYHGSPSQPTGCPRK